MANWSWEHLTWPELAGLRDGILVFASGSIEQHGPRLPVATDTLTAQGFVRLLQARMPQRRLIAAPPMNYTYAKLNSAYPGTINLNGATLLAMAHDILADVLRQGFRNVMFINGHMESVAFIMEGAELALAEHRSMGPPRGSEPKIVFANWWEFVPQKLIDEVFGAKWPGWEAEHAALTETSLMLHLWPELVRDVPVGPSDYDKFHYRVLPWPERGRPASGCYADPAGASAEIGRRLAEVVVAGLQHVVETEFPQ
jgi:creatinine amidohydrolase